MKIKGTRHGDNKHGTGKADKLDFSQGGNDKVKGLGGDDVFTLKGKFTAADKLDGGKGFDTLSLKGDYSAGVVFGDSTIKNIEKLLLAAGFGYSLTSHDNTVAAGATLTVDATALIAGQALTFNGSAETDGKFAITGGAGDDVLTGGAMNDTFGLSFGGNDTATGGNGDDTFNLGAALTAADKIDGGNGTGDTVNLDGDYSGGVVFDATTVTNVEKVILADGHSYSLTVDDATNPGGMVFDASALTGSNAFTFEGSDETSSGFTVTGGAGADSLTGGAGDDTLNGGGGIDFIVLNEGGVDTVNAGDGADTIQMGGALTAADSIDGGADKDILTLNGDYSGGLTFGALTIVSIEEIDIADSGSVKLTMIDVNVASGLDFRVDATNLTAIHALNFDGAAETDGSFTLRGGAGADTLTGGAKGDIFDLFKGGADTAIGGGGDDTFNLDAALTAADAIDGGAGNGDSLTLGGDYSTLVTFGATTLLNVETITLGAGFDYNLATNDATIATGATLTVDGIGLGASDTLTFDGSAETDATSHLNITGGAGDDVLTGGSGDDSFTLFVGGADTASGGAGNDIFAFGFTGAFTAADKIDGGAGSNDIISLNGDFAGANAVAFSATTLVNVERINLNHQFSYDLKIVDATVASGATLTVNASALDGTDSLKFNGAAETDGSFLIKSGNGSDELTGGANADTFSYLDGISLSGDRRDTIHGFDFAEDLIKFAAATGVDATVTTGTLNAATFDADLAVAMASLASGRAGMFQADAGDQVGHTFLIVDKGVADAGYDAGVDLVIDITGFSGAIGTAAFIA